MALIQQQQHRWSCSWPWLPANNKTSGSNNVDVASPSSGSSRGLQLPRQRPQRLDIRRLLDRQALVRPDSSSSAVQDNAKVWLPSAPPVEKPRAVHNAASLAFLGDSIYEVYARRHFLTPPQDVNTYSKRVMNLVCCEAQDSMLQYLLKGSFLTDVERDVLRWGKNIETGQRRASRRAGTKAYSSASSLETLIGYLYLTDQERLQELMAKVGFSVESSASFDFGFQTADKDSSN